MTPEQAPKRTLTDIVGGVQNLEGSCGWPHGDELIVELRKQVMSSQCLQVIDDLVNHVQGMGIAERFRRDKYPGQFMHQAQPAPTTHDIMAGGRLNEAGHKRAALLAALERVRSQILTAFHDLELLRLDIEATNMNDDGTHVPTLSDEQRRVDDLLA